MRVAVYVRQSLDRSGEALAVARQEADCRDYAGRHGWTVEQVYIDNDASATTGKPRPAWTALLTDLRAGRYDVLVCWHTDRLYRRLRDLVDLVEIAENRSLRIASVKAADIDLSTPAGRMLAGMLGHAARYEVEQKGARQVAANRASAQRGHVGWTRRPFGYTRRGGKVVLVAAEARELRNAAKKVLAGATLTSVVSELNRRGVATSSGGRWLVTSLRRLLLNPRLSGRVVYRGEDFGAGAWPAVFDPDTSDRLAALLNTPGRRTSPPSTKTKYLLSGLLRCGKCGGPMFAAPANSPTAGRWMIYKCRGAHLARRLDLVDQVVEGVVIKRLSQPDAAALIAPDVDLDALRAKVNEARDRRDGLAALLADGLLGADAVRTQAARLTAAINELEQEITTATGDGPLSTLIGADDVRAVWDGLPLLRKRAAIQVLLTATVLPAGKGARFAPDQVSIEWRT